MRGTFVPSLPELVTNVIVQIKPCSEAAPKWGLVAAAFSDQLFWMKLKSYDDLQQIMIGLPTHVALSILPQLDEESIRVAWGAPEACLTDLEQLSRSLPSGNHKLVIAPVSSPHYGEIRVTALY